MSVINCVGFAVSTCQCCCKFSKIELMCSVGGVWLGLIASLKNISAIE